MELTAFIVIYNLAPVIAVIIGYVNPDITA